MSDKQPAPPRVVVRGMVKEAQDHEVAMREARKGVRRPWFALPVVRA
jgi:hypothetical protein